MTASTIPLAAEVARQAEGRLTDGQTAALIEGLDPAKFATDGAVDPALVGAYLDSHTSHQRLSPPRTRSPRRHGSSTSARADGPPTPNRSPTPMRDPSGRERWDQGGNPLPGGGDGCRGGCGCPRLTPEIIGPWGGR